MQSVKETTPETEKPVRLSKVTGKPLKGWGNPNMPPGPGRPKGTQNKVTANIRAAVERAAREVTTRDGEKGLTAWLLERARGGIADRQIFAGMVKAALPLKVDATVQTISINLGWLGSRPIDGVTLDHAPVAGGPVAGGQGNGIIQAIEDASGQRVNATDHEAES